MAATNLSPRILERLAVALSTANPFLNFKWCNQRISCGGLLERLPAFGYNCPTGYAPNTGDARPVCYSSPIVYSTEEVA
jgi:hypothetical protein